MKSLEALENIVKRTAIPYFLGMYENEDHMKDLKTIKRDLEMLEEIKKGTLFVGLPGFGGNAIIIDHLSDEQYQKIKQWREEE